MINVRPHLWDDAARKTAISEERTRHTQTHIETRKVMINTSNIIFFLGQVETREKNFYLYRNMNQNKDSNL